MIDDDDCRSCTVIGWVLVAVVVWLVVGGLLWVIL